jgi:hypothetical protein
VFTDGPQGGFTCEFESGEVFEFARSEDRLYSCAFETGSRDVAAGDCIYGAGKAQLSGTSTRAKPERQWMADQVDFDDVAPEDEPFVEEAGLEELPRIEAAVGRPPIHFQHQAADLDAEDDRAIAVPEEPLHAATVVPAARVVEPAERVVPVVLPAGAVGSVNVDGRRASARIAGRRVDVFHTRSIGTLHEKRLRGKALANAFLMFAKQAYGEYGAKAVESAESELRELQDRKVFSPIALAEGSKRKTKKGKLGRLKARLVAMDSSAESQLRPDKDAPTAWLESMLMVLAVAGSEGRRLMGIDVGNALLEADMAGKDVIVEVDAWVSRILRRTRHLSIRYHFAGDLVKRSELQIKYCASEEMLADGLTKPLLGNSSGNCVVV